MNESRAFVELTSYIERSVESGTFLFKLFDIHCLYVNRLEEFGIKKVVNKPRLKSHVLARFPHAQEQCNGKSTILVFNEGMTNMLKEALKVRDFTEVAVLLAKAAAIVRKDIFNHQCFKFTGSFPSEC